MAGESPDRSKQRESSAEPTSGSEGPVPGARSGTSSTREPRDPRLAVARDAEKSGARGGVDTATRVLSVPTTDDDPDETPTEEAPTAKRASDAERDENDSDVTTAAERADGDTDASADVERDESDSDVTAAAERADADADASADAERDENDSDVTTAAERADADADTPSDAERDESDSDTPAADADSSAGEADGDTAAGPGDRGAGAAAGKAQRPDGPSGAESGEAAGSGERDGVPGAGDERLRDAVAAWVTSADRGDEESAAADGRDGRGKRPDSADGGAQEAEESRETAEGPEEPAAADTEAQEAEESRETAEGPEEPAAADTEAQEAAEAAKDAESGADGREAGAADDADEDEGDAEDRPQAGKTGAGARGGREDADGPEADRSGASGREDASEDDSEAGEDARTDETPQPGAADAGSAGPEAEDDAPGTDTDTDTGKAADADGTGEDDDSDGDGPAAPPVDQPTAVFKAVRPPVDQPTTMLKFGGVAKDVKGAEDAPERESERTSKFVALKPLDDPSTRKPASTPEAGQTGQATPAPAPRAEQAAPADATAPVPAVGPERTTQQPLPPRPPLDLLAELTNTPPPPDTPLRTAVRRVKIWTPLVLLLVVLLGVAQSVRPLPTPTLDLTAEESYTFEGGKVDIPWPAKGQAALDVQGIGTFGSSGEQKPVPIASVAKVMTAYLVLRDHPMKSGEAGPKIEIDQAAEDQSDAGQESTVDVTKGDKITQREAVESILIASANNVARLLARWDAGSEKAFVRKMNDAAKDLGMKNTTYTDPSGLNNTTVSTAVDQVKLAKAAMQQPVFREVATMMSYVDYKGTEHDNWNRLVGYNDVTGIKTGTTTSALGNLVFSARKEVDGEPRRIIGAVVRQPAGGPDNTILGAALHEGDQLIRAAQGALKSATILKKGDVVGYADDGLGGRTPVAVTEDVTAVGWAGLSVKLTFAPNDLPHEAKAGTKVGTLTVGDGTTSAVKVPVALQKDLVEPGFADKLTRLG
ncbi:D-alanyl-D-alanine carboxypeptidase [Streptomyces djakartensis]|uniref:serine-type D-Ala-D-Ala carboxypeptidase n=1 Tax=Streptomyces djakartensis TaxID=68193 RepID=A0ABQ2ZTF3_9ACTN|nr:D-alanyl-D-alanine carboxypeptidase [Streptomyces djakartensis]GGY22188.1 D-alanyl-D-alanine carboxypeptidase [Streptomyces djakartensis]